MYKKVNEKKFIAFCLFLMMFAYAKDLIDTNALSKAAKQEVVLFDAARSNI